MGMRGCPATGRFLHVFDKTTHRCACGRWERGYKPAKAFTKARGECQVCENEVAFESNENAGHHGYKRPGIGSIVGDCYGVGHKAFPAWDALEEWRIRLERQLTIQKKIRRELPKTTTITRMMERIKHDEHGKSVTRNGRYVYERVPEVYRKPEKPFKATSGSWSTADHDLFNAWDRWNRELDISIKDADREIAAIERERDRVVRRIEKAKSMTVKKW